MLLELHCARAVADAMTCANNTVPSASRIGRCAGTVNVTRCSWLHASRLRVIVMELISDGNA